MWLAQKTSLQISNSLLNWLAGSDMTSHGLELGTGKNNAFVAFIEFVHMSDPIPHVAKTEWCQGDVVVEPLHSYYK